jgi:phospholipid/cholesterol/gamma-HCH transport system ATP-binding protein
LSGIELKEVSYIRDKVIILDKINLDLPQGKSTAVIGVSGSGKTSLLKVAAGLIPPDTGDVFYEGRSIQGLSIRREDEFRLKTGFCFQDAALWSNKSIFDNMTLPVRYHFPATPLKELQERADTLLRQLGYRDSLLLRPSQLSTGERKIVSFARSVVNNPDILFLDDPLLSVDPHAAELITNYLKGLKSRGTTIFLTSHDPRFLASFSDFIVVIDEGKVIDQGAQEDLKKSRQPRTDEILTRYLEELGIYNDDILSLLDEGENPFAL